jgi:hypothetical protein
MEMLAVSGLLMGLALLATGFNLAGRRLSR